MPLPSGLIDLTIRRATREQRDAANAAARDRDWPTYFRNRDAVRLVFQNGRVVELSVSPAGLDAFLEGVRRAHEENAVDDMLSTDTQEAAPEVTPLEHWKVKVSEAVGQRSKPKKAKRPKKTVWDRLEDDPFS
jgi:hypothetical protein